ncbi:MAG: hypothetical protein S4CHLAM2_07690 [Chlamydiales bacterium]|nr:hypothetical protein [Chlamydiales bacterium]
MLLSSDCESITLSQLHHPLTETHYVALEEFLYGWAGKKFADQVTVKNDALMLFTLSLQSIEQEIVLIACGPMDSDLEAKALEYAFSLKIESY